MSMNETSKTVGLAGAAILVAVIALVTAPRSVTPDVFADRGEPFFPDFTDPNVATTLEVIEFDEETGAARPFKVAFTDGQWTIPSHHGYPADGEDRLARTAAGVIGITRDDFRSDNVADHESTGVIDPLDETVTSLTGRGRRVTLRNENDRVLADFIIGNELPDRPGFRFVRIPDQKRVYAARMDIDVSTRFEDWIEPDLLDVTSEDIDRVVLRDYSIDETTLRIDERDDVTLAKVDGTWTPDEQTPDDEELDTVKVSSLVTAVDQLSIVGVRPKPEGISARLTRVEEGLTITQADVLSLQSRGYYLTRDGQLRSNEGELQVETTTGLRYTLRFGEVLFGTGEAISAGAEPSDEEASGPGENRYLFITVEHDPARLPEPPAPESTEFEDKPEEEWTDADRRNKELQDAHTAWADQVAEAEEKATELAERFAPWYYVISSDAFEDLDLTRADLMRDKPAEEGDDTAADPAVPAVPPAPPPSVPPPPPGS